MNFLYSKLIEIMYGSTFISHDFSKTAFINLLNPINSWVELLRSESNLITMWIVVYLAGINDLCPTEKLLHSYK